MAALPDLPAIAELHAASWQRFYRGALSDDYLERHAHRDRRQLWEMRLSAPNENQHVFVAERDSRLVGFACVYGNQCEHWGSLLDNIHVTLDEQGKGVGRQLLLAVVGLCGRQYAEVGLHLWVLQSNVRAQAFYAQHGATNAGTDVWASPGGAEVPRFRFSWPNLSAFHNETANPSIERRSTGKPVAPAHVKR